MKMRRLALVAGVAALSAVAFSPKAQAQTTPVEFGGTIPTTCNFTGTTNGSLAPDGSSQWMEGSGGSVSGFNIGTSGATSLNCNGAASVAVSVPAKQAAPSAFDDVNRQALLYDTGTGTTVTSAVAGTALWAGNPTTPFSIAPNTTYNFKVAMNAGKQGTSGNTVPGTYTYTVTVTATPN